MFSPQSSVVAHRSNAIERVMLLRVTRLRGISLTRIDRHQRWSVIKDGLHVGREKSVFEWRIIIGQVIRR